MTVTNRFEGSWARLLAVLATAALLLSLVPTLAGTAEAAHPQGVTERVKGEEPNANRFGTARQIALAAYPNGSDTVVLARADVYADALAGSLIAGTLDAPILVTEGSRLTGVTAETIRELGANRVVLLGGTAAISAATETEVEGLEGVDTVERIDGRNRFDTARLIAQEAAGPDGTGVSETDDGRTAILATGENFADALAAGPLANGGQFPLLLTATDYLSGEAEDALVNLEIDHVFIGGGPRAVSEAVETKLTELGITSDRVNVPGGDRTHTAVEFAKLTRELIYQPHTGEVDPLNVATGADRSNGVDALALAPLAVKRQADLVITRGVGFLDGSAVDGVTQPSTYIRSNCEGFGAAEAPIQLAGGPAAISEAAEQQISEAATCADFVPAGALSVGPDATNRIDASAGATNTHTVTVAGDNALEEPAEGAVVQVEVYTNAAPPATGDSVYREGTTVFVLAETATVTLGEDGTAPFEYDLDGTNPREDRIVACALPGLEPAPAEGEPDTREDRSCTTTEGDLPQDVPYGQDVAEKSWVNATASFDLALTSAEEVGDGTAGADAGITGTARVLTDTDTNTICWRIAMDPESTTDPGAYTAAHLHEAAAGAAGPAVVPFGDFDADSLTLSGCATLNPAEFDVSDVETTPADYYVNVHSEVFPGGAARAQLS